MQTHTPADAPTLAQNEARTDALLDREWRFLEGGGRTASASGRRFEVTSPYTEERIAEVPDATREDVTRIIDAALDAAGPWGRTPARERGRFVSELADAIEERADDFAVLDSLDGGAPYGIMRADVVSAVATLRYFAGLALELKGRTIPASENLHYTELQPYGVVGKIIPFNHPFMFAAGKIAAPLVAGNAVVLKPAEATPLSALLLADLAERILPAGVLSIVVGNGPEAPDAIVRHPKVKRIGFIGSAAVGRSIQAAAAAVAVKHITLELGGKNALVALPDADPAEVAAAAVQGMNFTWSGQSCGSTSRLLVHDSIADDVIERAAQLVAGRRYPSPLDPGAVQGTMVSRKQFDRAMGYIDGAKAEGARVLTGGGRPASAERGLFIEPTMLEVEPSLTIANEEVFGPVLSVIRWSDEAEAIRIANSVEYGLTGSVFTNDVRAAHRVARALDTGFVWVNGAGPHYLGVPYGGWKNSGTGSEESVEELLSYAQLKAVTVLL